MRRLLVVVLLTTLHVTLYAQDDDEKVLRELVEEYLRGVAVTSEPSTASTTLRVWLPGATPQDDCEGLRILHRRIAVSSGNFPATIITSVVIRGKQWAVIVGYQPSAVRVGQSLPDLVLMVRVKGSVIAIALAGDGHPGGTEIGRTNGGAGGNAEVLATGIDKVAIASGGDGGKGGKEGIGGRGGDAHANGTFLRIASLACGGKGGNGGEPPDFLAEGMRGGRGGNATASSLGFGDATTMAGPGGMGGRGGDDLPPEVPAEGNKPGKGGRGGDGGHATSIIELPRPTDRGTAYGGVGGQGGIGGNSIVTSVRRFAKGGKGGTGGTSGDSAVVSDPLPRIPIRQIVVRLIRGGRGGTGGVPKGDGGDGGVGGTTHRGFDRSVQAPDGPPGTPGGTK